MSDGTSQLESRCLTSYELSQEALEFLSRARPITIRQRLAVSAIDLATEHHSGFVPLMRTCHYASAAAMLRPTAEASTSAWWMTYVAKGSVIQSLSAEGQDTPTIDVMIKELAAANLGLPGLKNLAGMRQRIEWRRFHKFTHGGMIQLERRFSPETFSGLENRYHLLMADLFMLAGVALGTVLFDSDGLLAWVVRKREELYAEGVREFGVTAAFEPWPADGLPPAPADMA